MRKQSFPFNRYPNVFERLGYSPAAIEARTQEIFIPKEALIRKREEDKK